MEANFKSVLQAGLAKLDLVTRQEFDAAESRARSTRAAVDEAETMGVPMVVGAAVRQMLAVTKARFGADSDFTHVAKLLEEWAGVEIRG